MKARKFHLHDSRSGSSLAVRVTPRSRQNEIVDIFSDGTIRIRLTSGTSDTESNLALISFLAQLLEVDPEKLEIVAGITGRDKLVAILDMGAEEVHQKIISHLQ